MEGFNEKTTSLAPIRAPIRLMLVVVCESDGKHTPEEEPKLKTDELELLQYEQLSGQRLTSCLYCSGRW